VREKELEGERMRKELERGDGGWGMGDGGVERASGRARACAP
jgi:hypothetical protein